MKKIVCYLLIVWTALMSGGANAHVHSVDHHWHHSHEAHSAHDHDHDHDDAAKVIADPSTILADSSKVDVNNTETLTQAHYSHGHSHHHAAGLPASCDMLAAVDIPSLKPVSRLPIVNSAITNNIERPKWPVTTPAVVSLLS